MIDLTVLCVYRPGGDFTSEYVDRLRSAVARNLREQHRFVCLTDHRGHESIASRQELLHPEWPGWWSKIEAFRFPGPLLFFDLDTVIVGNLEPLAQLAKNPSNDGQLWMIRDFYHGHAQSGVMAWNGSMVPLYRDFCVQASGKDPWTSGAGRICPAFNNGAKRFHGDADWAREHAWKVAMLPDVVQGIYSYKVHVASPDALPGDAAIVCFHGKPRPHEVIPVPEWMVKHWFGVVPQRTEVAQ